MLLTFKDMGRGEIRKLKRLISGPTSSFSLNDTSPLYFNYNIKSCFQYVLKVVLYDRLAWPTIQNTCNTEWSISE